MKSKPNPKPKTTPKALPKTFQGEAVVRSHGMNVDKLETFVERNALDQFYATKDMWLVIQDKALEDADGSVEVKALDNKDDTVVAQARANGNIDHCALQVRCHRRDFVAAVLLMAVAVVTEGAVLITKENQCLILI